MKAEGIVKGMKTHGANKQNRCNKKEFVLRRRGLTFLGKHLG